MECRKKSLCHQINETTIIIFYSDHELSSAAAKQKLMIGRESKKKKEKWFEDDRATKTHIYDQFNNGKEIRLYKFFRILIALQFLFLLSDEKEKCEIGSARICL